MTKLTQKPFVLRDEIHGDLSFDPFIRGVVDHPHFQRLRKIKQLGLAEYVFPGATHTRFQHSLGAAFLATQYFQQLFQTWSSFDFKEEEGSEQTRLFPKKTKKILEEVSQDPRSYGFWHRVFTLAALLHDIGHGPWSHTFESLPIVQDYLTPQNKMPALVGAFLENKRASNDKFYHEEISLLYIHEIFLELEEKTPGILEYYLPVVSLIHRGLCDDKNLEKLEGELERVLDRLQIRGGVYMHRLLRPLISGPFDVDRIDYIQRDGRNSGVSLGGIEWRRILTKVVPCLAEHPNDFRQPRQVVLVSHFKNQHVLDDFIFSLYQMYTQVYLHPKIVGLEEHVRLVLKNAAISEKEKPLNLAQHASFSDEIFLKKMIEEWGLEEIKGLLQRKHRFEVVHSVRDAKYEKVLENNGYHLIELQDRPMMKDLVGVLLYQRDPVDHSWMFFKWEDVSAVSKRLLEVSYGPRIWTKRMENG